MRVPKLTGLAKEQSEVAGHKESYVLSSLLGMAFLSSGTLGVLMRCEALCNKFIEEFKRCRS